MRLTVGVPEWLREPHRSAAVAIDPAFALAHGSAIDASADSDRFDDDDLAAITAVLALA